MAHISSALLNLSQQWGELPVWHCSNGSMSGSALLDCVVRLSAALSARLRVGVGDRIGFLSLNTPEYLASLLAAADAGAISCPLNFRWSAAEVAAALALVRPCAVLVDDACLELLQQAAARPGCPPFTVVLLTPLDLAPHPPAAGRASRAAHAVPHAPRRDVRSLLEDQSTWALPCPGLRLLHAPGGAALVVFTSGTTSAPKGAVLSHAALMHQSMAKLAVVGYHQDDIYLHVAPLCHIGGLSSGLAALMAGAQHVFMPRYSAAEAARIILCHGVTAFIAVPTMMEDMVKAAAEAGVATAAVSRIAAAATPTGARAGPSPAVMVKANGNSRSAAVPSGACLPSVRRMLVGGGGMRPQLVPPVLALFPNAVISSAYGMTEAASSITFLCPAISGSGSGVRLWDQEPSRQDCGRQIGNCSSSRSNGIDIADASGLGGVCVGLPAPGIQVTVAPLPDADHVTGDSTSGSSCGRACVSAVGEVLTRGPHVMSGYWEDPEQTEQVLLPGGWFRTGDLGWLDSRGRLWLLGRVKDMVKSGGENVHAREVEEVMEGHPAVAAAAVVGLPHPRLGEMVSAAVVLHPGWSWRPEPEKGSASAAAHTAASSSNRALIEAGTLQAVSAAQLQDHCRASGLTSFKLPRMVAVVPELPRNSSGKVVKPAVKRMLLGSQPRSSL